MSSKNTIILTNDFDEHWFSDCSEQKRNKEGDVKDTITLEFNKENVRIEANDNDCLILTILNVDSELYKIIEKITR